MSTWRDIFGTVNSVFRIGLNKASVSASGLTAPRVFTLPDLAGTVALTSQLPTQPPAAVLTDNTVITTETVVAKWSLPANLLVSGAALAMAFAGQVSSTATLIFKVRMGTLGTTADALLCTFATSAAGVANAHVSGAVDLYLLSGTAATATGQVRLASAVLAPVTAAFAAATIAPTSALFVTLTLVQSVAQTYTSRAAALTRRI